MVTGLRILYYEDGKYSSYSSEVDSADTVKNMNSDTQKLVYFESNGAAKTGTTTITLDGTSYTFSFKSNGSPRGVGETAINGGYIYLNGLRLTADEDSKYGTVTYKGEDYLVNESGTIQKNKKNIKDADDTYYCTSPKGVVLHSGTEKCTTKH